jgi:UDP-N-acetylglucosamine 2-epimerase (non-hydrolysing)
MKRILHVVGARPNFMKIAPIMREMAQYPDQFEQILVHTGQHYDANMSQVFFDELDLPRPDVNLEVGSGSHAVQTAEVMTRFEPVLLDFKPDWMIVPGDVNSTLACTLVAAKLGFKVAHVEAGLRSFDRTMPEEINRVLTDHLADLLFTTEQSGSENLQKEGIPAEKIHFVGNTMIDTLVRLLPRAEARWPELQERLGLDQYMLVTLHRPSNVDEPETLREIMLALLEISLQIPVIFPVHPRTRQRITDLNLVDSQSLDKFGRSFERHNLQLTEPLVV